MKGKNKKGEIQLQSKEPEALKYLKCLSEQDDQYINRYSSKSPYGIIQNEALSKWHSNEFNHISQPSQKLTVRSKQCKFMPKYHFEALKRKRHDLHVRKYTDNFPIKEDNQDYFLDNYKSQREVPKTRCAITLLNENFKQSTKPKRYETINTKNTEASWGLELRKQTKRSLAIRKIKKQILNGSEQRKMTPNKDTFLKGQNLLQTKIVLDLPKKQVFRQPYRHKRFTSLHYYSRFKNYSAQHNQKTLRPLKDLQCDKIQNIVEFKILKKMLSNERI